VGYFLSGGAVDGAEADSVLLGGLDQHLQVEILKLTAARKIEDRDGA
jgi:hypothetical protein